MYFKVVCVTFLCFQANFESDVRSKYLELLGYNKEELALKVRCPF